jgi:hypothetical protein
MFQPKSEQSMISALSEAALLLAGLGFIAYPALRPFSDEVSLAGAAAFGSEQWILAHMIAMISFTFLLAGLLGLSYQLRQANHGIGAYGALLVSLIGVGFSLPFYGGEAYGLHAVGSAALAQSDAGLLELATAIRSGAGLMMFVIGLLLLAAGSIWFAVDVWKADFPLKWAGIPLALGMSLYLPQFFGNQPLRIAHGMLVAIGCWWVALMIRGEKQRLEKMATHSQPAPA